MMLKSCLRAAACALSVAGYAGSAQAATIVVTPTLAPNANGSPNWATWRENSIAAQLQGLSSLGAAGTPSNYLAQSNVNLNDLAVTSFNSWKGFADPGTVFGPAFANEKGTRGHFGLLIDGDGQQIAIGDLSFVMTSNDAGNTLGSLPDWAIYYDVGSYNYTSNYRGVLFGGDGVLGGVDDTFVTSGPNTQMVDMIVGVGSGNAWWPGGGLPDRGVGRPVDEQQAIINNELLAWEDFATEFTGTYTIGSDSGTGTFNIAAPVPEPATWMMMIVGFGAVGGAMRRKRGVGGKALAAA